jgi:hypothetical protein
VSGAPALGLTRENLPRRARVRLARGGAVSPHGWLVDSDAGRVVVKDFGARAGRLRASLGRWLAQRECRVHERLASHPAVPRLLARIDERAFALEHRPAVRFSRRRPWTFSREIGLALEARVRELHACGVVHLDLAHRSNVRAGLDGAPVLIDFGAALAFRPGGLAARWVLPLLARVDRRAVAKWQRRLADQPAAAGAGGAASEGARGESRPT